VTPRVTRLRERRRSRVEVELDGAPWRVLPADVVVRCALRVGREVDRETARSLARELRRSRALDRATRVLAVGDRSLHELRERLAGAHVPRAAREEAIDALQQAGLVDEERLASDRAAALARRGYGDAAIRADLARRVLPADAIAAALAGLPPEPERIRELLGPEVPTPQQVRRFAARGFSRETLDDLAAFAHEP
jgi:SOS response regulatory protein OraA/RecX